jgi:hypothetical protein
MNMGGELGEEWWDGGWLGVGYVLHNFKKFMFSIHIIGGSFNFIRFSFANANLGINVLTHHPATNYLFH